MPTVGARHLDVPEARLGVGIVAVTRRQQEAAVGSGGEEVTTVRPGVVGMVHLVERTRKLVGERLVCGGVTHGDYLPVFGLAPA